MYSKRSGSAKTHLVVSTIQLQQPLKCVGLGGFIFTQLLIKVREHCKQSTYNRSNSYYNRIIKFFFMSCKYFLTKVNNIYSTQKSMPCTVYQQKKLLQWRGNKSEMSQTFRIPVALIFVRLLDQSKPLQKMKSGYILKEVEVPKLTWSSPHNLCKAAKNGVQSILAAYFFTLYYLNKRAS